jgi:hypothetical protein
LCRGWTKHIIENIVVEENDTGDTKNEREQQGSFETVHNNNPSTTRYKRQ